MVVRDLQSVVPGSSRAAAYEGGAEPHVPREELPFVVPRLTLLLICFALVMVAFGYQLYRFTVVQGPELRKFSENNFLIATPVLPPRGRILDRNGLPLAINQIFFEVSMSPYKLKPGEIRATLERLALLLGRPTLLKRSGDVAGMRPKWKSVKLADRLQLAQVLPVLEQAFQLPGVEVKPYYRRAYPEGPVTSLITGHVGGIPQKDLTTFQERGYLLNEKIGKLYAERTFEDLLRGEIGQEIVVKDAQGRPRARRPGNPAKPGQELLLTIDLPLQRLADQLLEGFDGVIVAMDPRDGAILAMAARKNYDPNHPSLGFDTGQYNSFNKVTRGEFAPGSTFKIVTAAAGLAAGRSPSESVSCNGSYFLGKVRFPCHLKWGHGSDNMFEALQHSCNVYFYTWAQRVGAENMTQMAAGFGFGTPTGFELTPGSLERGGTLARPGIDTIYGGSVLQMGIGQGSMINVTPLQMVRAYGALANGGRLMQPRILRETRDGEGNVTRVGKGVEQGRLPLTDAQRAQILEGLWQVTHEPRGTAARAGLKPEWRVAGKTGTAQTGKKNVPANAWFACFAPFENPEIVLVILYEEAGHGGDIAAPVARQLLAQYFGTPEPIAVPPTRGKAFSPGD